MGDEVARHRSLARRFGGVIALVALVGMAVALGADGPWFEDDDQFVDAAREIGGAIVSGAILAALVVWFEDRREAERVHREEQRDDEREALADRRELEAAERAWRREIDIRLVSVSQTDLPAGRVRYIRHLSKLAGMPNTSSGRQQRQEATRMAGEMTDLIEQIRSMLRFLRDARLNTAWEQWTNDFNALEQVGPGTAVGGGPLVRDPELHDQMASDERRSFALLTAAISDYVETRYPVEPS